MSNKFNIPADVEERIRARDTLCVYCRKEMIKWFSRNRKEDATIEHFREEGPFYWKGHPKADPNNELKEEDLAICCRSCNSSRRKLKLSDWFRKPYCLKNEINERTVSDRVLDYLRRIR